MSVLSRRHYSRVLASPKRLRSKVKSLLVFFLRKVLALPKPIIKRCFRADIIREFLRTPTAQASAASFSFGKTSPFQSQVFTGVFSNVGFGFAKTSPSLNSAKRCSRILPAAIYRRRIVKFLLFFVRCAEDYFGGRAGFFLLVFDCLCYRRLGEF